MENNAMRIKNSELFLNHSISILIGKKKVSSSIYIRHLLFCWMIPVIFVISLIVEKINEKRA